MVLTHILLFFLIYSTFASLVTPRFQASAPPCLKLLPQWRFLMRSVFFLWIGCFLINCFFSGGLPIYWRFVGDPRTYVDFGVPSFSGFSNALRLLCLSFFFLDALVHRNRLSTFLLSILIISTFAEFSRGAIAIVLLHLFGIYTIHRPLTTKAVLYLLILSSLFFFTFGLIGEYRYEGGSFSITQYIVSDSTFQHLPPAFFWGYAYIASPLNNIIFAFERIDPSLFPDASLRTLVPSIFQHFLPPISAASFPLASSAFNALSFYGPLLFDFGPYLSIIPIVMLQSFCSIIHIKAKQTTNPFFVIAYASLFACLALSVFYMYFLSLVTIAYWIILFLIAIMAQSLPIKKASPCADLARRKDAVTDL